MKRLLLVCAELVPVGVLVGALAYERWRRNLAGERPPQSEKLLREPGHTLRIQLEDKQDRFSMWFGVAMIGGLVCTLMLATDVRGAFGGWLVGALAAAVGTVMGWRTLAVIRPLRLGIQGEQAVAEKLQSLVASGYHVFHDVPGSGKWNIDHVVIGPSGVFAIETKARRKKRGRYSEKDHEVNFDGSKLTFPWGMDAVAPEQARRNAAWLGQEMSKATGERVTARPILAFPGWLVTMKVNSELKVLNAKQVPGFIREEPRVLGDATIQRVAYQLEQRCRDVEF